jgi:hypothetical protein
LGKEYRPFSSSLCHFLYSPVTSSLLGPNILLSTLFSNTLNNHNRVLFELNIHGSPEIRCYMNEWANKM